MYAKHYGNDILGRYPTDVNEVFLYLPISYQPILGKDYLQVSQILIGRVTYELVGVKYFYDNHLYPECLFTEEGFRVATAIHFLTYYSDAKLSITLTTEKNGVEMSSTTTTVQELIPSFDIAADKIYVNVVEYQEALKKANNFNLTHSTTVSYDATYHKYNYQYGTQSEYNFSKEFTDADFADSMPALSDYAKRLSYSDYGVVISDELLCEIAEGVLLNSYKQVSLFFADDKAAHAAAERLQTAGYIAVPSDTTYEKDALEVIGSLISGLMLALLWGIAVVFLAFFINLCFSRALGAFKGEIAIMRSMGIPVGAIRIGMYFRMLLSLIPAVILLFVSAILIFTNPQYNKMFTYLYGWQYALIVMGMLLLTVRTTRRQIRKLFGESVKKSLKGGAAE